MIKPVDFGFNAETAVNNTFQSSENADVAQENALKEFTDFVSVLTKNGIRVTVIEDTPVPHTPDSIFPNNWISFHEDDNIILYPMFAANRRAERKQHVLDAIKKDFIVKKEIDLTGYEAQHLFLEGTGSMVLDRDQKLSYACISPRTDEKVLNEFCRIENYKAITFTAVDANGVQIYHTNVMMCVGDKFVVICLESIPNEAERKKVITAIEASGKKIISISLDQMNSFAGNMLQVVNDKKEKLLIMSTQAFQSLTANQIASLEKYNRIVHSSLDTIEKAGGGSARCMMAEIFLDSK